jgi:F-type H+-transporting ATPase subunit a
MVPRQYAVPDHRGDGGFLLGFAWRLAPPIVLPARIPDDAQCPPTPQVEAKGNSDVAARKDDLVNLSSDQQILWRHGFFDLNGTIVTTWIMMILMGIGAKVITRTLATGGPISRWQGALEIVVTTIEAQIKEVGLSHAERYLPFLGTLFVFIAMSSLCTVIPGFAPPTGSLSTTAALAACVFLAVPYFGIEEQGVRGYLKTYTEPTMLMLPFNIISELSRTLALAVRLFGNMMSGVMIIGILLTITPLLFPLVMLALGLLTGMVQAYIFSILAAVYIAAATRTRTREISHG